MRTLAFLSIIFFVFPSIRDYKTYDSILDSGNPEEIFLSMKNLIEKDENLYFPYVTLANIAAHDLKDGALRVKNLFPEGSFRKNFFLFVYYRTRGEKNAALRYVKKLRKIPDSFQFMRVSLPYFEDSELCNKIGKECNVGMLSLLRDYYRGHHPKVSAAQKFFKDSMAQGKLEDLIVSFSLYANSLIRSGRADELFSASESFKGYFQDKLGLKFPLSVYYYYLSGYYMLKNQMEEQVKLLEKSYEEAVRMRDYNSAYNRAILVGSSSMKLGKVGEGISILNKSIDFFRKTKNWFRISLSLDSLALGYWNLGLYAKAKDISMEALEYLKRSREKDLSLENHLLCILSDAEATLGNLDKAEVLSEKALREAEEAGYRLGIINATARIGKVYSKKGETDRAITYLERAAKMAESNGVYILFVDASFSLAHLYLKRGDTKKALSLSDKALKRSSNPVNRMKLLHLIWKIKRGKGIFYIFLSYPFIKRAYHIASEVKGEQFPSIEEKYRFLEEKTEIFENYSKATKEFAGAMVVSVVLVIFMVLMVYSAVTLINEKKKSLIGPYQIKEEIGRGGMGMIYRAKSIETGYDIALKVIRRELSEEDLLKRFKREGEILKKLNHPNIVRLIESGEHGENLYIAMEYMDGESLKDLMKQKFPLPMEVNFEIARQILTGMSYIHSKGVIHRDIKPSNIMIVGGEKNLTKRVNLEGRVKLMDFGVAKSTEVHRLTATGEVFGTPYFMPPEMLKEGETDHRGDIYSFGVTLYWLVAGEIPFYHTDIASVIYKILNLKPAIPSSIYPEIPECLDNLIMKCMEKDMEKRYQNADEILRELELCRKNALSA